MHVGVWLNVCSVVLQINKEINPLRINCEYLFVKHKALRWKGKFQWNSSSLFEEKKKNPTDNVCLMSMRMRYFANVVFDYIWIYLDLKSMFTKGISLNCH